ncbi:MAG: flagellin [Alphaproteobacteria bacterium]|nr:flagellin [Alphaproteobacteria bacterium]
MAISSVSLTAATRVNLYSLQQISSQIATTQARLATGLKVASSLDNSNAYFTSVGFLNRANDLSNIKDSLSTSLQTVKAASGAIDSITKIIQQAQGLTTSALQTADSDTRSGLAVQFNDLLVQVNSLVNDATFNGTNLIGQTSVSLVVYFNEKNTSKLTITNTNLSINTGGGLSVAVASAGFVSDSNINTAVSQLTTALTKLRVTSSSFGNNTSIITTRQDFTNNLITTLQEGSDALVLADTNEESAKLLALQTRNELAITTLNISGEIQKSILNLFGG